MTFGAGEIIVIVFVLVVVFSASRMGQLGNAIGRFVYSFKKASSGKDLVDAGGGSTPRSKRELPPEDGQIVEGERKD